MQIEPTATGEATYCPEDNKLRLYVGRVPRDEFDALRKEGWSVCSKQREAGKGDFAAVWTPEREDTARAYSGGYIGDEDAGPAERAADRAERFSGYRENRREDARREAGRYEAGDRVQGNEDLTRAERAADRLDRCAGRAVDAWGKAEYWQHRTAGVIAHALYLAEPGVRMGRIKRLEAEQRKHEAGREEHRKHYEGWQRVAAMDGADELLPMDEDGDVQRDRMCAAQVCAYTLANTGSYFHHLLHPDGGEIDANGKRVHGACFYGFSAYDFLTHDSYGGGPFRRLTPKEYAEHYLNKTTPPESYGKRWADHYALRLAYERQMLEAEGGRAGALDMEPGGWLGKRQIQKVNKSHQTGRVVSVAVWGTSTGYTKESGYTKQETRPCLVNIEVERLAPGVYRPPTDEERAAFAESQRAAKEARKATEPKAPPLVNPTDEDAERLQAAINAQARERNEGRSRYSGSDFRPAKVFRMPQEVYSLHSKGAYSRAETRDIAEGGKVFPRESNMWSSEHEKYTKALGARLCKIRVTHATGGGQDESPDALRVIVLTDKPQKPIPAAVWGEAPTPEPQPEPETEPAAAVAEPETTPASITNATGDWNAKHAAAAERAKAYETAPPAGGFTLETYTAADIAGAKAPDKPRARARETVAEGAARRLTAGALDTTGDLFDQSKAEMPLFAAPTPAPRMVISYGSTTVKVIA